MSSPDSNDSGIQADSAQNFHHLSNDLDDLYGVVKKIKRKPVSHTMDERYPTDSMTSVPPSTVVQRVGISPVDKQRQSLDDPYATVEVDSDEEDADDAAYAVVRNKKKGMRIVEEVRLMSCIISKLAQVVYVLAFALDQSLTDPKQTDSQYY